MKLLDRLNRELITILVLAGFLFTCVFIVLAFFDRILESKANRTKKVNDRQNGYNIYKVLDGSGRQAMIQIQMMVQYLNLALCTVI